MPYRFIDHTGDTAVVLTATDDAGLLREATRALRSIFVETADGAAVADRERRVELEAEDGEALLIDYLNELIFLFDSEALLPVDLEIDVAEIGAPARIHGTLRCDLFDPGKHVFLTEIKAATFHGVKIRRAAGMISATVVFDL